MSKAKELLKFCNEAKAEAGFDHTDITAANWEKVLDAAGAVTKAGRGENYWIWQGDGIVIRTGNDPITGKYALGKSRPDEKNFASYIGLEGDAKKVKEIYSLIKKLADDIKDEDPNNASFI